MLDFSPSTRLVSDLSKKGPSALKGGCDLTEATNTKAPKNTPCERGKSPFKPLQRARLPLEECESGIAMDRWPRYWLMTDDSRWLQPSTAIF